MSESVESSSSEASSSEATTGRVEAETLPLFSEDQIGGAEESRDLHTVKVLGEEKRIPYDELIAGYQKAEAADKKFRESAEQNKNFSRLQQENQELRASTEALLKQLKEDPFGVLSHESLGLDVDQMLYDKMNEKMEYEEMDEYERENLELRQRLERYEQQEKKIQEEKTKSESMARQEQYASTIKAALQQAGIAPTPDTIRLAASHLYHSAEQTGYPTITWKEMVERTKGSLKEQASAVYGTLPPEQLAEYLGDDVVQKIRKHDIQKVKNNFRLNQPDVKAENVKRMPKTQMSKEEFRSKMAKIKSSLA